MNKFTFGFDIGITSVGFAVMNQEDNSLVELGTRKFQQAGEAADARGHRGSRRNIRRRKWRLNQLKQAFLDFGLLTENDFEDVKELKLKKGYLEFTATHKNGKLDPSLNELHDRSVYHLRKRALREQVTTRELMICLYHIVKTRGHFLMEEVDFSKGNIKFEQYADKFYQAVRPVVTFINEEEFSNEVLIRIFKEKLKQKELKELLKKQYVDVSEDENAQTKLLQILLLLEGFKCDFKKIGEDYVIDDADKQSFNIVDLKKKDTLTDFSEALLTIYDMSMIYKVLKEYDYVCEKHVDQIDKVIDQYDQMDKESDEYKTIKKDIQASMNAKTLGNRLKVVKNINNIFPNGLYVKELTDILLQQKQYNQIISDEFIEVCQMITRARIPYYMGPLSQNAKNAWMTRKPGKVKYSYEYALKKQHLFDEAKSVEDWKKMMISRCTYLPDEYALPKGSFTTDLFAVINEINILKAVSQSGDIYYLTQDDKFKIIDELFLKQKNVTFQSVKELLNLKYYGTRENSRKKFNSMMTLYHQIISIVPEYRIEHIQDVFKDYSMVDRIDNIVFALNIYEDTLSKRNYFEELGIDSIKASQLSKLNSKDFTTLSRKFITESPMDENGLSLLEKLFEDNTSKYTNEQMTLITNCTAYYPETGEIINYTANKYEKLLNENNSLGIHLLLKDNKPYIPISRPVIRALNETFKVFNSLVDLYGMPNRVVIETARDLKDSSLSGEETGKHFDEMKKYHEYLLKECKDKKIKVGVDSWNAVSEFIEANKKKVELYIRQNGVDLITGYKIDINHLLDYEIDHILPRGFGDNSMNNLMLISKATNAKKGDRLPIEFIRSQEVPGLSEQEFVKRVSTLLDMKLISEEKKRRLLLETQDEAFGFIQRNLVDTRYIIKEFTAALNAYLKKNQFNDTKVVSLQGGYNGIYRKAFRFRKNRDVGDQHHAHDAAIIIIVDKVLSHVAPHYESRKSSANDYRKLLMQIHKEETDEKKSKGYDPNEFFIRSIYNKAFKVNEGGHDFLSEVQDRLPLISNKVERKVSGSLFNATILPQSKRNTKSPLDLLGVNNDQRIFTSIECVAIDFYKVTDKKGNKKHYAIPIPKVIVNGDGTINEEQYKKIVKDFYQAEELMDGNRLRTECFRLRFFSGDFIYDTSRKSVKVFNGGSIANKTIEVLPVKMIAYNKFKAYEQPLFKMFYQLDKEQRKDQSLLLDYIIEGSQGDIDPYYFETYKKKVTDTMKKDGFFKACDKSLFLLEILKSGWVPVKIDERNRTTANSISKDPDAQYVKIVTSPLGIRFYKKNEQLFISGPNDFKHNNRYKLIKKEKFTWKI